MNTGCQGPFVRGVGGWCGCDCKCCPPEGHCAVVAIFGPPASMTLAATEEVKTLDKWAEIHKVPKEFINLPDFKTIEEATFDKEMGFLGMDVTCSIACDSLSVPISVGGSSTPACLIQIIGSQLFVVGNGTVTAPSTIDGGDCGTLTVKINGQSPPVFLCDGEEIVITLEADDCCNCELIGVAAVPMAAHKLWQKRTIEGKAKMGINKQELIRRIATRKKFIARRKKS